MQHKGKMGGRGPVGVVEPTGDGLAQLHVLVQAVAVVTVGKCSLWSCQGWGQMPLELHWLQQLPALMTSQCTALHLLDFSSGRQT